MANSSIEFLNHFENNFESFLPEGHFLYLPFQHSACEAIAAMKKINFVYSCSDSA